MQSDGIHDTVSTDATQSSVVACVPCVRAVQYSTIQCVIRHCTALRYTLRCLNQNQAEEDAPVDAVGVTVIVADSMVIKC